MTCLFNEVTTLVGHHKVVSLNKFLDAEFKNLRIFRIIVEDDVDNLPLKFILCFHFSAPSRDYKQRTALKLY